METTGLVLQLYRAKFGEKPLIVNQATGRPYDVAAALTKDGKTLTLSVVNPTTEEIDLQLAATGLSLSGEGTRWSVAGSNPEAHNAPGQPRVIDIQRAAAKSTALKVPALSATLFELPLK
jgi:alpha-N-arabinofuranosidase